MSPQLDLITKYLIQGMTLEQAEAKAKQEMKDA